MTTATSRPKTTPEEALALAAGHMQAGNFRTAEDILQRLAAASPGNFKIHYFLGLARYNLGNTEGALAALETAAGDPGPPADFWCNYGAILAHAGKNGDALKAFDAAIALDAAYPDPHWNKAHVLWTLKHFTQAEQSARDALAIKHDSPEALVNLGLAQAGMGQNGAAIASWEKALELRPDFIMALNNLGNMLREKGQLSQAEHYCRRALAQQPAHPQALNNLGNVLQDQGRLTEAEDCYKKAIALKPDYAEAHNNLAVCLMLDSRPEEAATEARYATLFQADYALAHMNLARALRGLGRLDDAEKALAQAVALEPQSVDIRLDLAELLLHADRAADAGLVLDGIHAETLLPRSWIKLAAVLERAGRVEDAMAAAERAVTLNPEMPEALLRLGQICHSAGQIEKAHDCYSRVISATPDAPLAHVLMAELHQTAGDAEKSETCLRRALALAPRMPSLYLALGKIKRLSADGSDLKNMTELAENAARQGLEAASTIHFALYAAHEDLKNFPKAFAHLETANTLKKKTLVYNRERQEQVFRSIKSADPVKASGCLSDVPVFIVGMPRSGTTLTEQILVSHPDVFAAGELYAFARAQQSHGNVMTSGNAADIGRSYVEAVRKLDPSGKARRITDKMPGNFLNIGQIATALPNAKIIHCTRNALDTCFSCYKQSFAQGHYWSYDLRDTAAYYKLYEDLMAHWRAVLPGRFLDIGYEDTVRDLEGQARKILDYVGLEWNDACLEPHRHKRPILTASKMQITRPVYQSSVNSWKIYENELQPLIAALE